MKVNLPALVLVHHHLRNQMYSCGASRFNPSNLDVKFVNESVPVKVINYRVLCSSSKHVSLLRTRSFFFGKKEEKLLYFEIEYDNDTTLITVYTRMYIYFSRD